MVAEANRDEGLKCLEMARVALAEGNHGRALKFATKARNLYPSPEVGVALAGWKGAAMEALLLPSQVQCR